jgi:hypothetical protein
MSDDVFSHDGRVNLPPPSVEALAQAARDVLGEAGETHVGERGVRVFAGTDGFYLQEPDADLGTRVDAASRQAQDELMDAAAYVRAVQRAEESRRYTDPATNPLIKVEE